MFLLRRLVRMILLLENAPWQRDRQRARNDVHRCFCLALIALLLLPSPLPARSLQRARHCGAWPPMQTLHATRSLSVPTCPASWSA